MLIRQKLPYAQRCLENKRCERQARQLVRQLLADDATVHADAVWQIKKRTKRRLRHATLQQLVSTWEKGKYEVRERVVALLRILGEDAVDFFKLHLGSRKRPANRKAMIELIGLLGSDDGYLAHLLVEYRDYVKEEPEVREAARMAYERLNAKKLPAE